MKPTESLPLKEWYLMAEEMATTAGKMIEIGKEIESLPEDADKDFMFFLEKKMKSILRSRPNAFFNPLDKVQELIQAARGEA